MTEFVLVPGAWLGSSVWDEVAAHLRAAGHGTHAVTLAGVADRRGEQPAGQQAHVRDVVEAVEGSGLRDVVLVGHSYSGIPVGQAAGRIGDRLTRVVYVDANVPVAGGSFVTGFPGGGEVAEAVAANGGSWAPPGPEEFDGQGLTPEQTARLLAGATPHPGASLTEPAALARPLEDLPTTYVKCLLDWPEPSAAVAELLTGDTWELVEMDTGHWPMFSQPDELARVLLAAAGHAPGS
ncbi:putative esterase [Actinacidiphila reveromycinica]|uniref:Putative esterase n=1 Tax=Actinacidiphila reveromycinica TaxID=659352 RepID=A0A7U3UV51_9ACTN|nr:alpha/beta hydrolase [Streptomyces sp. SN-593]BBA99181.1 putative esterase [Streptomyces sp. SN-593]